MLTSKKLTPEQINDTMVVRNILRNAMDSYQVTLPQELLHAMDNAVDIADTLTESGFEWVCE